MDIFKKGRQLDTRMLRPMKDRIAKSQWMTCCNRGQTIPPLQTKLWRGEEGQGVIQSANVFSPNLLLPKEETFSVQTLKVNNIR